MKKHKLLGAVLCFHVKLQSQPAAGKASENDSLRAAFAAVFNSV